MYFLTYLTGNLIDISDGMFVVIMDSFTIDLISPISDFLLG